jgi:hypothetical protein
MGIAELDFELFVDAIFLRGIHHCAQIMRIPFVNLSAARENKAAARKPADLAGCRA